MRILFEEEKDIKCGMYIIRNSSPINSNDYSFAMTVLYKIGFDTHNDDICKISLTDGMVMRYKHKKFLMKELNEDKFGYRILNKFEVAELLINDYKNR